eukprot:scaffold97_cov261-Pinguiococcus_pyrenoidosus.AAC.31
MQVPILKLCAFSRHLSDVECAAVSQVRPPSVHLAPASARTSEWRTLQQGPQDVLRTESLALGRDHWQRPCIPSKPAETSGVSRESADSLDGEHIRLQERPDVGGLPPSV